MKRILIVAAENSAENYALQVIEQSVLSAEEVRFCGVGGDRMQAAGMDIWVHSRELEVVGIVEVVLRLRKILGIMNRLFRRAVEQKVDAVLLIDYPDFNLKLARRFKRAGIPVYYYISPTVWAWRYSRVKFIRRWVDHLFVIFPFEREIYQREKIPFTYTGHPLLTMVKVTEDREILRRRLGVQGEQKLLLLFPGSRRQEVKALLPSMIQAVKILSTEFRLVPVIVRARNIDGKWLGTLMDGNAFMIADQEDRFNLIAAADAVLTTHGTSNLEIALVGTPFAAVYRVNNLSYIMGKWLVKIKQYSIVNILAEEKIVAELVQSRCRPSLMAREIKKLFIDGETRSRMLLRFREIKASIGLNKPPAAIIWEKIIGDWNPAR